MTCPMMMHLGVYALGAADDQEQAAVASHLETCADCRAELAGLEPLPGLLARVPESRWAASPHATPARRRPAHRMRTRSRQVIATTAAASAAAGAAGGFWLARPGPATVAAPAITATAANPATHVRATVSLTGTSWGTSIQLVADGLPLNVPCSLIVHSRSGGTEITGVWDAWSKGPITVPASAGWRPRDIASLQVATETRTLVTITTGRSSAAPASNPGTGR